MKDALARMFSSAKVWTVIIGGLATAGAAFLAKHGFEVSDATIQQLAATMALLVGILVHAQGQADVGKAAAKINAAAGDAAREFDATGTPPPVTLVPVPEEKKS